MTTPGGKSHFRFDTTLAFTNCGVLLHGEA
jgi:hypothetical protein